MISLLRVHLVSKLKNSWKSHWNKTTWIQGAGRPHCVPVGWTWAQLAPPPSSQARGTASCLWTLTSQKPASGNKVVFRLMHLCVFLKSKTDTGCQEDWLLYHFCDSAHPAAAESNMLIAVCVTVSAFFVCSHLPVNKMSNKAANVFLSCKPMVRQIAQQTMPAILPRQGEHLAWSVVSTIKVIQFQQLQAQLYFRGPVECTHPNHKRYGKLCWMGWYGTT